MARRSGFTLLEVMISVAILGLSAAAGLKLLAMSARSLEEVRFERSNLSLARSLWLKEVAGELEERGRENDYSWETMEFAFDRQKDVPEGFTCRKITLVQGDPATTRSGEGSRSFVFYLPDLKTVKDRTE